MVSCDQVQDDIENVMVKYTTVSLFIINIYSWNSESYEVKCNQFDILLNHIFTSLILCGNINTQCVWLNGYITFQNRKTKANPLSLFGLGI